MGLASSLMCMFQKLYKALLRHPVPSTRDQHPCEEGIPKQVRDDASICAIRMSSRQRHFSLSLSQNRT